MLMRRIATYNVPMSEFKGIPVVTSGQKYEAPQGFKAIKDGIKHNDKAQPLARGQKPKWLRMQLPSDPRYYETLNNVKTHKLATVCEESKCPNIGECWSHGTATIMLMGAVCTRACRFCSVDTGNPAGWLDAEEPQNAANSVRLMNLQYIVLTSVDRDDLPDGGAQHYADCITAIRAMNPQTKVEALTPDFQGRLPDVEKVVSADLQVFAQNLETVRRLTHPVRDPRASYEQTLKVLQHAKQYRPEVLSKTSLMLGLGETEDEIQQALDDMREAGLDIVTFGQYLQPTRNHLAVERYVTPDEFARYREWGLERGFLEVVSGPLVRSSYRADKVFAKNNVGL